MKTNFIDELCEGLNIDKKVVIQQAQSFLSKIAKKRELDDNSLKIVNDIFNKANNDKDFIDNLSEKDKALIFFGALIVLAIVK